MAELQAFINGFGMIFELKYFVMMFGGVTFGLILGALPGLTGSMGIALMLPFTYNMPPLSSLVFLLSIYSGGLFGGASTLIPGQSFDEGGLAYGKGYLPKATAEPELVLSPTETSLFSRFVEALENGGFGGGGSRTVHAPITVIGGGTETADVIEQRLLKLMP